MVEKVRVASTADPNGRMAVGGSDGRRRTNRRPASELKLEDRVARDHLAAKYLPLVRRLCRRFRDSFQAQEDLVQVGSIGLLKAIDKFDPDRGVRFITYAVPVIVGEIKNYLRDHGWAVKVPRKLQKHKMAVKRAVESLTQELGRPPTVDEIGEATLLTQAEVFDTFEVAKYGNPLSLDAEYGVGGDRDGYSLMEFLGETDPHLMG